MIHYRPALLTFLLVTSLLLRADEPAVVTARKLARDGVAAADAKDYPLYLAKMEAAVALRPDYPRLLVNLAGAQALNENADAAIATLTRLAALGVSSPVEKSDEFAALRDREDFKAVSAKLAGNLVPSGAGEYAFMLPGMTGLIEGIAVREKTGEFFFGDVHLRCVWVRAPDGKVRRFSEPADELLGVFGLAVDEANGTLWAATTALPAMQGYTKDLDGAAGVAEFDLTSGKLRRVVRLPADGKQHVFGDLTVAPDGSVYLPDSGEAVLWRLAPGATAPEVFLSSPEFMSLQGVAITPDGRTAILSDYANGLLRLDLATRDLSPFPTPPNTTLLGIDGLALAPDGSVLAVQSGVRPKRILRLTFDSSLQSVTQVTVLESGHLTMADPTLGCIAGGQFVFVGNAGWSRFEGADIKPTDPRPIPIFHTKLDPAVPVSGAKPEKP
jgi:sugar lactone lactonase YvrE